MHVAGGLPAAHSSPAAEDSRHRQPAVEPVPPSGKHRLNSLAAVVPHSLVLQDTAALKHKTAAALQATITSQNCCMDRIRKEATDAWLVATCPQPSEYETLLRDQ